MKRLLTLLLALILTASLPALAEVSLQDLIDANADVHHESAHLKVKADLNCGIQMESGPMTVPISIDMDIAAKGDRTVGDGTLSSMLLGPDGYSFDFIVDQGMLSMYINGERISSSPVGTSFDLSNPVIGTLPQGGTVTGTEMGWSVSYDLSDLMDSLGQVAQGFNIGLSGTLLYNFDADLHFSGLTIDIESLDLSSQGVDMSLAGSISFNYVSFDDVTDADMNRPLTGGSSKAA